MDSVFTGLTDALGGAPHMALAAAFAWGVLSIVLSPCHLASIPLIIGFIQGQDQATPRRAALPTDQARGRPQAPALRPGVASSVAGAPPPRKDKGLRVFGARYPPVELRVLDGAEDFREEWTRLEAHLD